MIELVYISPWGGTLDMINNPWFWTTDGAGLTHGQLDLSSVTVGSVPGDEVTNMHVQPRTFVWDLRVKTGVKVEEMKRAVTAIIKLGQTGVLKWTQEGRTLIISGVVEAIDEPRFNNAVVMQVTIHCSQPFWTDLTDTVAEIDNIEPLHYFTYLPDNQLYFPDDGIALSVYDSTRTTTVVNAGDYVCGMIIEVEARQTVTNPIIVNERGEFFGLTGVTLLAGEKLVVCTIRGEKSVKVYNPVYPDGIAMWEYITPGSTWFQLRAGENTITVDSDDSSTDNMSVVIRYRQLYV